VHPADTSSSTSATAPTLRRTIIRPALDSLSVD
jgi:hypothetical protein